MLKIDPDTEVIEDAAFQTYGCGSAIASSSALTEMIKGKTIKEAQKITNAQIAEYLDGLPPEKMHCSVMGREALDAAIANYHGKSYEQSHDDGELVCHCFGVGINKIKKAIWENHLTTVEEVTNYTKAGGGCGSCKMRIEEIIDEVWEDLEKCGVPRPGTVPTPIPSLRVSTVAAQSDSVRGTVDEKTRNSPYYEPVRTLLEEIAAGFTDGSTLELDAIADQEIRVKLGGASASGMMKEMALNFITVRLKERLGQDFTVKAL